MVMDASIGNSQPIVTEKASQMSETDSSNSKAQSVPRREAS